MNWLKKFWIVFLSFLPLSAGAVAPLVAGGIAGAVGIIGFSIYRSMSPVNMSDALAFFSSCWSCQMFSDVMLTMSNLLPRCYSAIGSVVIPFSVALCAIWFAWQVAAGFINAKVDDPWNVAGTFGVQLMKLAFVCLLLMAPLPRMITTVAIEPVFNVGLAMNRVASDITGQDNFSSCVVAAAIADPSAVSADAAASGAYSPSLRHNLACQVARVHQMTGLGMAVGWTMLNMSFNSKYMHKIMWDIPIFPNVPIFFCGLLVLALFFVALLPIPVYFLEIFITLSMDLIMLPLMLLMWLFPNWIFPQSGRTIGRMFDDVVKGTLGIAMTGVFLTFAIMFINSIFGQWRGASRLVAAIAQNDSTLLMDGLMMRNDSLITIILMGLFIAMFMTMIPALIKTLFNVAVSTDFYDTTKKNLNTMWGGIKKWYAQIKK